MYTHQRHYYYLLIIIATTTILLLQTPPSRGSSFMAPPQQQQSIYELLNSKGLPSGLFPKGIRNFTIWSDGCFKVYLDEPCDAKFESEIHYEKSVEGQLSEGQIGNLTGVSAQDLFLWFPVKGIRVDIPSSGVIYFDVGVVRKQFSVSLFDTPRDCLARPTNFLQKFGGLLRHTANWWWRNQEGIM